MIKYLVILFISLLPSMVLATTYPATSSTVYTAYTNNGVASGTASTHTAACALMNGMFGFTGGHSHANGSQCQFDQGTWGTAGASTGYSCNGSDTLSGTTCTIVVTCDAGGTKNSSYGKEFTIPGTVGNTLCVDGCSFNVTDSVSSATGSYAVIGRAESSTPCTTATGLAGKPATPASPPTPSSCLQQGQSYITMNSVTRCVGAGSAGAAPATVTQNATGAVSGVAGTSTTQIKDHIEGGQVTRTVTETPAGGGAAVVTTTSSPQSSFCEKNPEAALCKEKKGSAGGGESCTASPTCDGDAIMCAQLMQAFHARCDGQQPSSIQQLGENVLNGIDNLAGKPDPMAPEEIPVGTLDTTEIFSASCPPPVDMSFSVMGVSHAMSFDLTPFCSLGAVLGILNVLGSLFFAGRMIAGGL